MRKYIVRLIKNVLIFISFVISKIPGCKKLGREMLAIGEYEMGCEAYAIKEFQKANNYFNKSLQFNNERATKLSSWYLGNMFENGLGVEKDLDKAEIYYLMAGDRGNRDILHKVATESCYQKNEKT